MAFLAAGLAVAATRGLPRADGDSLRVGIEKTAGSRASISTLEAAEGAGELIELNPADLEELDDA
ncbi:MAG: hypothetical protein WKF94_17910 [Solirubrobacteraceae bacterium]